MAVIDAGVALGVELAFAEVQAGVDVTAVQTFYEHLPTQGVTPHKQMGRQVGQSALSGTLISAKISAEGVGYVHLQPFASPERHHHPVHVLRVDPYETRWQGQRTISVLSLFSLVES